MSFNDQYTRVWWDPDTNGHYALGPTECSRNGRQVRRIPASVLRSAPHIVFGPMVPWAGGERPVDPDVRVRCLFRHGGRAPYIGKAAWHGHSAQRQSEMWHHAPYGRGRVNPAADIVAYQVEVTSG